MDVIGDLVARERRGERTAVRAPATERTISYHDFCTTAWKAGNALRYLGVGSGALVAVAPDPVPEPVLAFFGAAQLGAVTRFEPVTDGAARAVVVHRDREQDFELPPASQLVVYGGAPSDPTVTHWEGTVWSENPAFPPTGVAPDDAALSTADARFSHDDLLSAAATVVDDYGIRADDAVGVDAPLSDPRGVVGGVLAPLHAGATAVLGDQSEDATDGETVVDARDVPL